MYSFYSPVIVWGGTLNSTHSLTVKWQRRQTRRKKIKRR